MLLEQDQRDRPTNGGDMPSTGDMPDRYKIVRPLGKGGMGEVYLAEDAVLQRKVAIKFLAADAQQDFVARRRFLNEARSAAALDHPFICKIYETGELDGKAFIAMEYVRGESLLDRLSKGPLQPEEGLKLAMEIAEALEEGHGKGIVHRDLKPANIMITPQGHAKVMDFGVAKQFTQIEADEHEQLTMTGSLTRAGSVVGTLAYMSPEQLRGQRVDQRSDIFSFGILLYEIFSGRHPFRKPSDLETASAILRDVPAPISELSDTQPEIRLIFEKALAKEPAQRYQQIRELRNDLQKLREIPKPGDIPPKQASNLAARRATALTRWVRSASLALLAGAGLVLAWWFAVPDSAPPPRVERMSILIADFQNQWRRSRQDQYRNGGDGQERGFHRP